MIDKAADALPRAHGPALGGARMRVVVDDFFVDEIPGFELTGQGEHVFVHIRKRERTTDQVAGLLARAAGVPRHAVSYAGMKDKWALTQQWFSIHLPGQTLELPLGELDAGVEVLAWTRHDKKLRRGALRGNRFRLRIREVQAPVHDISERLARIARDGVPNYFGEQRFGRDGDNVAQARAMLAGQFRPRARSLRGILLSAARSHLFNQVLAERLRQGNWASAIDGDLMMLDGRNSLFPVPAVDEVIRRRTAALEIHPSGPLSGRGGTQPEGAAAALERDVLSADAELVEGLAAARLDSARRALRLRVGDLAWRFPDPNEVELDFALPAGAYATCVVRELFEFSEAV
jgi:tRNA pseudouridine13 synthase